MFLFLVRVVLVVVFAVAMGFAAKKAIAKLDARFKDEADGFVESAERAVDSAQEAVEEEVQKVTG